MALVALLLYFFVWNKDDAEPVMEAENENMEMVEEAPMLGAVSNYVTFVENDPDQMGLDHEYSMEALDLLTRAVEAKAADTGYDVKADLDQVQEYADKITNEPFATTHANSIRKAGEILSRALTNMQQAKYPALSADAERVANAATGINPDVLTLDQKTAVKGFFGEAADLLQKMN